VHDDTARIRRLDARLDCRQLPLLTGDEILDRLFDNP